MKVGAIGAFLGAEVKGNDGKQYAFVRVCDSAGSALEVITSNKDIISLLPFLEQFCRVKVMLDVTKRGKESDVFLVGLSRYEEPVQEGK